MKRVYKYGTGFAIPKGAQYLSTVVEEAHDINIQSKVRLVWHYFLVEVENE